MRRPHHRGSSRPRQSTGGDGSPSASAGAGHDSPCALGCDWTAGAGTFSTVAHLGPRRPPAARTRPAILDSTAGADDKAADKAQDRRARPATIPVCFHVLIGAG